MVHICIAGYIILLTTHGAGENGTWRSLLAPQVGCGVVIDSGGEMVPLPWAQQEASLRLVLHQLSISHGDRTSYHKTGDMCRRSSDKDSPHISSSQLCSSTVIPSFTSLSPHMHPCTHKQPLIYSSYYYMKQLYGALLIISTEPEKISESAHQM